MNTETKFPNGKVILEDWGKFIFPFNENEQAVNLECKFKTFLDAENWCKANGYEVVQYKQKKYSYEYRN